MPDIVVDSSFAIAFLVDELHSPYAQHAFETFGDAPLRAPGLICWEVANVLQMKIRRGLLGPGREGELLEAFEQMTIVLESPPDTTVLTRVSALAAKHGLSAYDAAYLELAVHEGADLATLDGRLAQAARVEGVTVHSPF